MTCEREGGGRRSGRSRGRRSGKSGERTSGKSGGRRSGRSGESGGKRSGRSGESGGKRSGRSGESGGRMSGFCTPPCHTIRREQVNYTNDVINMSSYRPYQQSRVHKQEAMEQQLVTMSNRIVQSMLMFFVQKIFDHSVKLLGSQL
jgi:hypothetical protein